MKKIILIVAIMGAIATSCNSSKATSASSNEPLSGSWELTFITGPRITFDGLYPNRKPTIAFETTKKNISGNASCNTFNGTYTSNGATIKFPESMALTRMMCDAMQGETVFLATLNKVNSWSLTDAGNTLNLKMGDVTMMRFTNKQNSLVGNDLDPNGCKASAGYTWSQVKQRCIRIFEDGVSFTAYDAKTGASNIEKVAYLVVSDDKTKAEVFFGGTDKPVVVNALPTMEGDVMPTLFENSVEKIKIVYYKDNYLLKYNNEIRYIQKYSSEKGLGKTLKN